MVVGVLEQRSYWLCS